MKFTPNSKFLMNFFINNNFIHHDKHCKSTNSILHHLYKDVYKSYEKLLELKKTPFLQVSIKKINNIHEISKPKFFSNDSFPSSIREHIDNASIYELSYTFPIVERHITIHFILEDGNPKKDEKIYNKYVDLIIMWLFILNDYSSQKCSKQLTIFLYFTSLQKQLPSSNIEILDQHNVNTAFTTTCPVQSEIVVFRKEEWFKVFIHETFHNFALDFSDMSTEECHSKILSIFKVNSTVNLFEAYTEFWAEILHSLFCSFFLLKNKNNFKEF
jgi:hypothetical protein